MPREFDAGHVYHLFPLRSAQREQFQAHMLSGGVETLIHYPLAISRQPALAATNPAVSPIADRVASEVVSLPMYPNLTDAQVELVAGVAQAFRP